MARGRFISFEGGEGCGKSTQVARLKAALLQEGLKVVTVREPGGTLLAEKIRGLLKDERQDAPVDRCELLLFLSARAQLVDKIIEPALARGEWVISDRFSDSTRAYQGYGRGLPLDLIEKINDFACGGLKPDLTFLLEVSAATAAARMRRRETATGTQPDRIESASAAFHARLRDGFAAIAAAEPERIVRINAENSVDAVWDDVWKSLKRIL